MRIRYNENGNILAAGDEDQITEGSFIDVPQEEVPVDFIQTFSLRKYVVADEALQEVASWEPSPTAS